ncbi:MAG: hypothetical protein O7D91_17085 [Planctomycetota bacterium]|nr:hypothetical protein [Planctomycetota bacterium]
MPLDDKGYYDRVCPASKCAGQFKVLFDDWTDKVSDARVFCPFCRHDAPADDWNTAGQQRYLESVAEAEMGRLLNNALAGAVRRTRPRQIGGGLLDITMDLSYQPGRIPPVLPATATGELRQDFVCEACGCRYASLGASFFCPACGHNSVVSCFDNTLETVGKTLAALPALGRTLEQSLDADAAKDTVRQLLEDQLPRLVGAFEHLNEALFDKLPNAVQFAKIGNVFQRVDDASDLWLQASGKGYGDLLNADELQQLKLWFQRRHVLAHRQGIVDQAYLDRSGDRSYAVGQRLVTRDADVREMVELVAKLVSGLRSLV